MQYLYIFPGTPVFQSIVLSRCKDTNPSLYPHQLTTPNTTVQSSALTLQKPFGLKDTDTTCQSLQRKWVFLAGNRA